MVKAKEETVEAAMAVKTYGTGHGGAGMKGERRTDQEEKIPSCTACGKDWHTEDVCYEKHGYEAVKARGRGRGRRGVNGGRGSFGRGGERFGGRGTYQANAVGTSSNSNKADTWSLPFNAEEIERIRIMLASSPEGNDKLTGKLAKIDFEWIVDSGCSHHMTGRRECLTNIRRMEKSVVGLPDGRTVDAMDHGEVVLNKNFILKDVLYVPSLQCDLISVEQLTREKDCVLTFQRDFCVMQDRLTRTEIGRSDARNRVYYFRGGKKNEAHAVTTSKESKLWHARLGHP